MSKDREEPEPTSKSKTPEFRPEDYIVDHDLQAPYRVNLPPRPKNRAVVLPFRPKAT